MVGLPCRNTSAELQHQAERTFLPRAKAELNRVGMKLSAQLMNGNSLNHSYFIISTSPMRLPSAN